MSDRPFVYLDTSVAIAHLLSETVAPPRELWDEPLVASRLLAHELHTRLRARGLQLSHGDAAEQVLGRVSTLEVAEPVVDALNSDVPPGVRTLDALHLASMLFLRSQGAEVQLASYDRRMLAAAEALGFEAYPL
ncbi:MAG: PIN domain-containing protein [Gemmatimonadetes bacterium]|nr:PIN domain-containing protein [Gemmatimonadota bacterium]